MIDESIPPKPRPSLLPIIFGFLIVIIVACAIGIAYYKTKLSTPPLLPSPSPTLIPSPSLEPSSTPSATPKSSKKPNPAGAAERLYSRATPVPQPTLDIRFGNPSANVKQTIDEGKGDGRVINREYTSIQAGQFDEVSTTWSPRVTVCFHLLANEDIPGKNIKFSMSQGDKIEVEDNMGWIDTLEAGKIYDWCHDVTGNIGKHTARLLLNPDKSLKEYNYTNDLARLEWENLADKIAPNFTLTGPNQDSNKTCLSLQYISDNVTKNSELKIEEKFDAGTWATTTSTTYCTTGTTGSQHTYTAKITDARGNVNEQNKTFVLY